MIILASTGIERTLHGITLFSVVLASIGFLFASYELLDRPELLQGLIRIIVSGLVIIIPFALIAFLLPPSLNLGFINLKGAATNFAIYGGLIGIFSGLFISLKAPPDSNKKLSFLRVALVGTIFASLYWTVKTFLLFDSPFYDFTLNKLVQELIGFAFIGALGGGFWYLLQQSNSLTPNKPSLFSLKDFLVGLVFWSGICLMICILSVSVFGEIHGITVDVSGVIVLGVALIVLIGGLASGFSRSAFWNSRAISRDSAYRPLFSSPITLQREFMGSSWRFEYMTLKDSSHVPSFSSHKRTETAARIIFWLMTWFIIGLGIWLIATPVFAIHINSIPPSLGYSTISVVSLGFLAVLFIGTSTTVLIGYLTIALSRFITIHSSKHPLRSTISSSLTSPTTLNNEAEDETEQRTTMNPSATNRSSHLFLIDSIVLLTSWYEIWFVFGVIQLLYFLFQRWHILLSAPVVVLIGISITVMGSAILRYFFLRVKSIMQSLTAQCRFFSLQDSLIRPIFWPAIWLGIYVATILTFIDEPTNSPPYVYGNLPNEREALLVLIGFVITVLTAILVVTLVKLISWWGNKQFIHLLGEPSSLPQSEPEHGFVESIRSFIVQRTTQAKDSPSFFSLSDGLIGLCFWSGAWFLCGVLITIVIFVLQISSAGNSLLNTTYDINIDLLVYGFIGIFAVTLAGALTGGLSKFIVWWTTNFRAKLFGAIGIILTLIGFLLQLVEPTALLSYLPYTRGHSDGVIDVAWSPDGKRIASASADNTVQVWEVVPDGKVLIYTEHFDAVDAVAWSPDSKYIASGGLDKLINIWNADTGNTVNQLGNNQAPCYAVAWSSDGKRIAATGDDGVVQIWSSTKQGVSGSVGFPLGYKEHFGTAPDMAWSPHGNLLAAASDDGKVRIWEVSNYDGKILYTYSGHVGPVHALAWSPDGKRIASAGSDNTVQIWDALTGKHVIIYRGHSSTVNDVAWSPDGRYIASASDDETAQVWNATNGDHIVTYRGHFGAVRAVTWSPDSTRVASASDDKTVQVWDAVTGDTIMTYSSSGSG